MEDQPMSEDFEAPEKSVEDLLDAAKAKLAGWTPEQRDAMWAAQRESFARANVAIDKPLAADGSRADLPEGAVMENGMKNQSSSSGRFYGRSTIYGKDKEHNTPFMTRWWFGRLRLHIFHRGDADPDPHDHPWGFWTFPLTSYVEEVIDGDLAFMGREQTVICHSAKATRRQVVPAFWPSYRPATHTHRVLGRFDPVNSRFETKTGEITKPEFRPGKVVTIVWRGPDERKWGFLKHRDGRWCWVAWRDYVFANGKSAPCE